MYRCRVLLVLVVIAVVVVLPNTAFAGPCTMRIATTAAERAALWNEALDRFTAARPGLRTDQAQFLSDAARLGDEIATLRQGDPEQAAFARKAARFMEQARSLFTNDELGALFTSMGSTQIWLAQMAAAPAYCNCVGTGSCTMGGGGPSGSCLTGCVSWTDDGGQDRIRVCSPN